MRSRALGHLGRPRSTRAADTVLMSAQTKGIPMTAVHIHTTGMYCPACSPRIEAELDQLPGVKRVLASRDLGLTSVMFDEDVVDVATIRDTIANSGFGAEVLTRGRMQ